MSELGCHAFEVSEDYHAGAAACGVNFSTMLPQDRLFSCTDLLLQQIRRIHYHRLLAFVGFGLER